jgi:hypothetical protein
LSISQILKANGADYQGREGKRGQIYQFIPSSPAAGNAAGPDAPPDVFTAFQQQLGLKLESTKAFSSTC